MKIRKLIKDIPDLVVKGSKEVEVSGVCSDSRFVSPGNLFIAKKGRTHDGNAYIADAVQAGAAAVVTDIYDPSFKQITQLIHPTSVCIEGLLASRFHHEPSNKLFMVGITGTNGKTTTAAFTRHLLEQTGTPTGLIGTIEYVIGPHRHQASHTTPDACNNHKMLAEMVREHCSAAVLEVTSHALDQGRAAGLLFDVAVYTNLSPEHLDYHATMEDYARAKNRLFRMLGAHTPKEAGLASPRAVVNIDCPWYKTVVEGCQAELLTYGLSADAQLRASDCQLSSSGSRCTISFQDQQTQVEIPQPGRFNIYNALAAIGVGICRGHSLQALVEGIQSFPPVPGRLQRVPNHLGIEVLVDFAHTPDALENALLCVRELKPRRLVNVFGCGGDRDRTKRPEMARISEKLTDYTYVTSDNPRNEEPSAICSEIATGFSSPARYEVVVDRRKAIRKALEDAQKGDVVVIAGRGHESHQLLAHQTLPFSDWHVANELCQTLAQHSSDGGDA